MVNASKRGMERERPLLQYNQSVNEGTNKEEGFKMIYTTTIK